MKRIALSIAVVLLVFPLSTCDTSGAAASYDRPGGGSDYELVSRDGEGSGPSEPGHEPGPHPRPDAGQLTAGQWSDIKNYEFYLNLFNIKSDDGSEIEDSQRDSQRRRGFADYIEYFGFETRYMVTVTVVCDELPVADAAVELYDSSQTRLFAAATDMSGSAYLFPPYDLSGETISVRARSGAHETVETVTCTQADIQITLADSRAVQSVLDLMFVIDTTGSMGDELRYLKSEISDVIGSISRGNPNHTINLALLFYRDIGDEYVTRYFDFTTDIAAQQQHLARQSANGGGDFPEAVDRALAEAVEKNWNGNDATRLIFHVCDAPPHDDQANQTLYFNSIKTAAEKGIRIIPVASSGIDYAAEYLLRQEALMTGGTYIFLTDDSGIGDSHLQPTVGEYTVEYLNACMVRVVSEYLAGVEIEPVPYY